MVAVGAMVVGRLVQDYDELEPLVVLVLVAVLVVIGFQLLWWEHPVVVVVVLVSEAVQATV